MTTLCSVACHNTRISSLPLPKTPLPPDAFSSSSIPVHIGLSQVGCGTGWAAGVGEVTLLHNHYRVPLVALYEVDLEVVACCHPSLSTPHWISDGPVRSR